MRICTPLVALALVACSPHPASAQATPASAPAPAIGYTVVKEGSGPSPTATDVVKVHYRGTFPDGREFDSSYSRGQPAQFPLDRVIRCWTEGVQRMKTGGSAKLVCPAALAYGERGAGNGLIPPNATLHFDVELIEIVKR
jgi:FKBP-type peptidyl-prolyl cis-trans isomerase FkpA